MATVPFDTLDFTRRLREGGFSAQQAETMADALRAIGWGSAGRGLTGRDDMLRLFERRVVGKVGAMLVVGSVLFFAAMKLFP